MDKVLVLLAASVLDMLLADPRWLYHPVNAIGWLIVRTEKVMRKVFPNNLRLGGVMMWVFVVSVSFFYAFFVLFIAKKINIWLYYALDVFMCYQMLAARGLDQETMKVYRKLAEEDIPGARTQLSYIVGRDTENLDEAEIAAAAVETIAENTSDGVTAPAFFFLIGGVPLMFLYKAVNTQDSIVGYKNDKYIDFGRYPALLDDVFNYIPARISALCFVVAAWLGGFDGKNSMRIFKRDRYNHLSPNSAQTEAAVAGALGIQLGGSHYYFGKLVEKPTIGDKTRDIDRDDIKKTVKLMYLNTAVFYAVSALIIYLLYRLY
ncbi:MAG: adenosylcobinamide-phosphate synthase CbiB [Eubacteriales bacterium]|nr:adenosylcobinamide-phosphate synthase CbiB [Eubacteriales bacterium]